MAALLCPAVGVHRDALLPETFVRQGFRDGGANGLHDEAGLGVRASAVFDVCGSQAIGNATWGRTIQASPYFFFELEIVFLLRRLSLCTVCIRLSVLDTAEDRQCDSARLRAGERLGAPFGAGCCRSVPCLLVRMALLADVHQSCVELSLSRVCSSQSSFRVVRITQVFS